VPTLPFVSRQVFSEIDEANEGEITYEQFRLFVHKLGLGPKTNDEQVGDLPCVWADRTPRRHVRARGYGARPLALPASFSS
jgi:hypothetical protein